MLHTRRNHRFVNWGHNQRITAKRLHRPRGDAAVQKLIQRAASRGETVKPYGAGHSWSDIALCKDHLVSLDRDQDLVSVNASQHRVTTRAGARLFQLIPRLAKHNLAFSNLGSVTEQSIAGATATGTHGSGITFGNLATQITGLTLITGAGDRLELSADHEPELFNAARVGLGALGIITQVTLQCEPLFHLEENTEPMAFDDAIDGLPGFLERNEHVKLWWLPHTDLVLVARYNRSPQPITLRTRVEHKLENLPVLSRLLEAVLITGRLFPSAIPPLNRAVSRVYFREARRVHRGDRLLNTIPPPIHLETEYSVPVQHAQEAAHALRDLVRREKMHINFIQELRFVAEDNLLMSPDYGRPSLRLGAYAAKSRDQVRYFAHFENLMRSMQARPHWGKSFSASADYIRSVYPEYDRFNTIRRELDPRGVFATPFIKRLFT